jgi:hypothetical protein
MFRWLERLLTPGLNASELRVVGQLYPECRFVVTIDTDRIACRRPSGDEESVRWADLDVVMVVTNDHGPFAADVWWLLIGRDGKSGCTIPQGATGEPALLDALQKLPGFDNKQLIDAMCCVDNRRFLCWRRSTAATG